MDDFKVIGKREEKLQKQLHIFKPLCDDIHTELGPDKCANIVLKNGKLFHPQMSVLDINRETQQVKKGKRHKIPRY
jgi:hypothetical protein